MGTVAWQVLTHGTAKAHQGGCRCDLCRAYNTERQRRWRAGIRKTDDRLEPAVQDRIGTAWKQQAACKDFPTAWWFEGKPSDDSYKQALRICANCPVRTQCLDWALQWPAHELHGIWGGTSQRERVRLTDQRKAPTCPEPITIRTTGRLSGTTLRKP